jgi:hypothetical protein
MIRVESRRGIQLVVLAMAAVVLWGAYRLIVTGDLGVWREPLEPPASTLAGLAMAVIGLGLVIAALRRPGGPKMTDPLLVGLILVLASGFLLANGATGLVTGVVALGRLGITTIGPPLSYPLAIILLVGGTVALYGAVALMLDGRTSD